ncbi:MAG: NAD(P)/FAD-dependent oxidoreductase, partial [Hyphomicrobiales bacterium]|nr:NAD(P)/FAD-dependent oxidoreductase [Hyphomicrobiales bacterium]
MRILVVGGGMGGTIFANNLARRLHHEIKHGKARITMLSASDKHMYQPGLLYVALGRMTPDELYREQASLLEPGIHFEVDPVETFDIKNKSVKTKGGKTHAYDIVVISTGSRSMPELIPGLAENSIDCYTEKSAVDFYDKLAAFKGGRILFTVGLPHKCPMIPLELAFTMYDFIKERGLLDKTEFYYTYPIGRLHSLENVGKWAAAEFASMGIKTETLFNLKEVDGKNAKVRSEEGAEVPYDLLVSVPPHKGMEVIEKNGLGQNGWIPTDKTTLHMEG